MGTTIIPVMMPAGAVKRTGGSFETTLLLGEHAVKNLPVSGTHMLTKDIPNTAHSLPPRKTSAAPTAAPPAPGAPVAAAPVAGLERDDDIRLSQELRQPPGPAHACESAVALRRFIW